MNVKQWMTICCVALVQFLPFTADASEGGTELKHAHIDVTDSAQLRRGMDVFTQLCMGCHSAKYVTYKDLMDYPEIGLTRQDADDLRGDKPLTAPLMTDLTPEDAKMAYGKVPPDLSVIVNARKGGADYVYSVLTGFVHDPAGKIPDGNYNLYFPGNRIAMPDPLSWLGHDPEETADLEKQAMDVATFLTFISDPHQNQRREIGKYVMGFLLLLTIVLYLLKREIWRDVKH